TRNAVSVSSAPAVASVAFPYTSPPNPATADRIAAAPAGRPARASHSSCASGATAAPMLTDPSRASSICRRTPFGLRVWRQRGGPDRVVVVVLGRDDARQALPGRKDQVEPGGHQPDDRLHAVPRPALLWCQRHRLSLPSGGR